MNRSKNLYEPAKRNCVEVWLKRRALIRSKVRALRRCLSHLRHRPPSMWFQLPLLISLIEMGYYERVRALVDFGISGQRILDLGCGNGFYGPIYLLLGAAHYTGFDYKLSLYSPIVRDYRTWSSKDLGTAARELGCRFRGRISLYQGDWRALSGDSRFDLVAMYLVTEHLIEIEDAFDWIRGHLVEGGRLVFLHHNFACWNGHHQVPRSIDEIDESSEEQVKYLDWNHLRYRPKPDEYVARKLNRIRLDNLRAMTEDRFSVQTWVENRTDQKRGASRLTPRILASLPDYTERELLTQSVHCVAVKES